MRCLMRMRRRAVGAIQNGWRAYDETQPQCDPARFQHGADDFACHAENGRA
jgi:hypothetical protein